MREAKDDLTPRETDVLRFVSTGLSDKLIARRLGIARSTVSNHVTTILIKLSAANRAEAVAIAMRDGLMELPPPLVIVDAAWRASGYKSPGRSHLFSWHRR